MRPSRPRPAVALVALAALISLGTGVLVPATATAGRQSAAPVYPQPSPFSFKDINPDHSDLGDADGSSGGRVNHLASAEGDDQTFYAASEFGGLYKSVDGGLTWKHLDRHLPQVTWDVAVDPSNHDDVFATSLADGRVKPLSGINVSHDAGAHWVHPATASPPADLGCSPGYIAEPSGWGLSIRPDQPQQVFVGTTCGVAISMDGGQTWTYHDPSPDKAGMPIVYDALAQPPIGRRSARVTVCSNEGQFYSTDLGTTWHGPYGPGDYQRCTLAASPDEPYVLFVTQLKVLYESDDGGVGWTNLGSPDSRRQGRVPFVATNQRTTPIPGPNFFDVWYGDVHLYRGTCLTPSPPAPGGSPRCPKGNFASNAPRGTGTPPELGLDLGLEPAGVPPAGWDGPFTRTVGGHDDVGDLAFDTTVSVDACPLIFASDGGVHRNVAQGDCHTPQWERSNSGLHALWLWGMDGVHRPGVDAEDLYLMPQDNGPFASQDAGGSAPSWHNGTCCDAFDVAADTVRVLYSVCCFQGNFEPSVLLRDPGLVGGADITDQMPGVVPGFNPIDAFDRWGSKRYVAIVDQVGVFVTTDISAASVTWTQLGAASTPQYPCGIRASVPPRGLPVFYLESGACGAHIADKLWKYAGTSPSGTWKQIDTNGGLSGGFNVWNVDPRNPNRLYASNIGPAGVQMVFSNDGGTTWTNDPELDDLMTGHGVFLYMTDHAQVPGYGLNGYPQPSLVAFDPVDPDVIVAGGVDSGVFLSTNDGHDWTLLDNPTGSSHSSGPHLPRPFFAHFDHDPAGTMYLYIGTVGRGVWRITTPDPEIALSPTGGGPGTGVQVTGGGFDPGGPVEISLAGALVATATAGRDGSFVARFTVPNVAPGKYTVRALSTNAGLAVEATFTVD